MNTTTNRLDDTETKRRRDLVSRAAQNVTSDSQKGRDILKLNDEFVTGTVDQAGYLSQLKLLVRGESAGVAAKAAT